MPSIARFAVRMVLFQMVIEVCTRRETKPTPGNRANVVVRTHLMLMESGCIGNPKPLRVVGCGSRGIYIAATRATKVLLVDTRIRRQRRSSTFTWSKERRRKKGKKGRNCTLKCTHAHACVRSRACVRVIVKDQVVRGTHTVGALDVVVFQMLEQFLLSCRNKSATIALEMVILPHVGRHCLSI